MTGLDHLIRIVGRQVWQLTLEPSICAGDNDDDDGWSVSVIGHEGILEAFAFASTLGEAVGDALDQLPPGLVERERPR